MRKTVFIFVSAFALNVVWENLHSFLYAHYQGGPITEFILIRASLFDAVLISIIAIPFLHLPFFRGKAWLFIIISTVVAVVNEWYGLGTTRWAYNAYMPIVPVIGIGLTPMLQLGMLGYASLKLQEYAESFFGRGTMPA